MHESQKQWEELTVRDNYLFQLVMRNKRICKHLIEKILHITIKEIQYPQFEKNIAVSLGSKSIRMDVFVEDDTGRVYDIEMQCLNKGEEDLSLRASYYQSLLQIEMLEKGAAYTELHPSYVIFICTFDPYGAGLPQYTFKRCCLEKYSIQSKDRQLQIFLNSTQADKAQDPDIASFLQYIDGKAAEGAFARQVEQEVQNIKLQEKWRWESLKKSLKKEADG